MKTNKFFLFWIFLLVAGLSTTVSAQSRKEKKEQKAKAVKERIVSENYKISVTTAYPRRGKSVQLSSPYSLGIRNDSVFSYLPYYGRAYSVPYDGGKGLIFNAPIKEYEMTTNRKGDARITFKARNPEDMYTFNVEVFSNGSASIRVNMNNRESISFHGDLELKD